MVGEYTIKFYLEALSHYRQITANNLAGAKSLSSWKQNVNDNWSQIRVVSIDNGKIDSVEIGKKFTVRTEVFLGTLTPSDVSVELYLGKIDSNGDIINAFTHPMESVGSGNNGLYTFEDKQSASQRSGLHGYTIRVIPKNTGLATRFLPGLITWA
jgi:starch phosphorylase